MDLWLNVILISVLLVFVYQDFKYRAIDWYMFLALPVIIIFIHFGNLEKMLYDFLVNCIFILFNSLILWAFFSLKNKKLINPLNRYIGTGDMLFFVFLALLFSPFNFILFFSASMFISLMTFLLVFRIRKKKLKEEIPLAGFVSALLLIVFVFNFFIKIDLHSDHWIINQLVFNGIY